MGRAHEVQGGDAVVAHAVSHVEAAHRAGEVPVATGSLRGSCRRTTAARRRRRGNICNKCCRSRCGCRQSCCGECQDQRGFEGAADDFGCAFDKEAFPTFGNKQPGRMAPFTASFVRNGGVLRDMEAMQESAMFSRS